MKTILHQFKIIIMLSLLLLAYTGVFSQTASAPAAGDGTESNPYQIATLDNLYWLSQTSSQWGKHFIQTANIDARTTKNWNKGAGFSSIGNETTKFTGSYNGKGHLIDSLFINRPNSSYIGLFGDVSSSVIIDSLGLTDASVTGKIFTGILAGRNKGIINNSFTTGNITANGNAEVYSGGFAGWSNNKINNCYSTASVNAPNGDSHIGGFIGRIYSNNAVLTNCYSTGLVTATGASIGGLMGSLSGGTATNCFWDTQTSGQVTSTGGTGKTTAQMKDINTYLYAGWDFMEEIPNGTNDIWGINNSDNNAYPFLAWLGYTSDAIACQPPSAPAKNIIFENVTINSIKVDSIEKDGYGTVGYAVYINSEDTWADPVDGTTPTANTVWQNAGQQCIYFGTSAKPEAVVTSLSLNTKYYFKVYAYNDCSGTEKYETTGKLDSIFTKVNYSVPSGNGSENNPYVISNLDELAWLMYSNTAWDKHYIQTTDIDARTTKNWDNGAGFTPIGNETTNFTGTYNGKGHLIDSLYINRPDSSYIGLFGYITNNGIIDSLGLTNASVTGKIFTGILVGWDEGIINNSFTTGNVTANGNAKVYSGGFAGYSTNKIKNCYSTASVNAPNGGSHVGGFIGRIYSDNAVLTNCYSTGLVTATGVSAGGLMGSLSGGTATNCFWDTQTSGQSTSAGGTGKTSVQMKDINTYLYANWDFMEEIPNGTNDIWGINNSNNNGYPFLAWLGYTSDAVACQTPSAPAKNIIFENITSNSTEIDSIEKDGYGTVGYAVYINSEDTWTAPVDGTTPTANTVWQNTGQQCIYFGTSAKPEAVVTNLSINTKYYFTVYAYNDCSGTEKYETTGKLDSISTKVNYSVPSGNGSESSPYIISNLDELAWLMYSNTAWDKHYIQTADIDARTTKNWDNGAGFTPIGNETTYFTGSYNGKEHIIDSLFINRPNSSHIAFWGFTSTYAKIDSLGLTNINITGLNRVGGLISYNYAKITNCYTSGKVQSAINGHSVTGGFVAGSYGIISNCFSSVNVTAANGQYVGGFAGTNDKNGLIKNSYSLGDVVGGSITGGFAGSNGKNIVNCYNTGSVTSSSSIGGFTAYNSGTITNCFWDTQTSGQATSAGGTSKTTAQMKDFKTFFNAGWDFMDETDNGTNDIWGINSTDNNGYPFLSWQGYPLAIPCQAPSSPAKNIIFENITNNNIEVDSIEKAGYKTIGYAVYINSENTWAAPVDGTPPTANTVWQNTGQQCIYLGTSTKPETVVTGLSAETKYFIKVYAYNDCSGTKKYETTGKLDSIFTKVNYSVPSGNGSESSPYIISNLDELTWLMYSNTAWDKHYIQTANIDARTTKNWNKGAGFSSIGNETTKLTGSYNGKGHIIDSLFINRPDSSYIGLFGDVSSSGIIDSLGLTNASVTGKIFTGILAGRNKGIINNSFTTGNITANGNAEVYSGGFAGWSNNKINNCYSTASVNAPNGGSHIGGFIGRIYSDNAVLTNCYSTGLVTATGVSAGGLMGSLSRGTATNCFWDTQTSGQATSAEGTGKTTAQMKDFKTFFNAGWDFMDETDNGTNDIWGINSTDNNGYPFLSWQGYPLAIPCQAPSSPAKNIIFENVTSNSTEIDSIEKAGYKTIGYAVYINSENTWAAPVDGTPLTANTVWQNTGQQCIYLGTSTKPETVVTGLSAETKYFIKVYAYNDCSGTKKYETAGKLDSISTKVNYSVPSGNGSESSPYIISNLDELTWLMYSNTAWDKHYIQTTDIDARITKNWNTDKGFSPIGNKTTYFTGSYNGKGHLIDSLYINRPYGGSVGFFGYIGSNVRIDSVAITNASIKGELHVGILVANSKEGNVNSCYTTGTCSNSSTEWCAIGGLIGFNAGIIESCYSTAYVSASVNTHNGGIAGLNDGRISNSYSQGIVNKGTSSGGITGLNRSLIENCYSATSFSGTSNRKGGLVGYIDGGTTNTSFWDTETSGRTLSAGGTGKTTAQMKDINTYLYAGWDFMKEIPNGTNDIWGINNSDNNGYPFLAWLGYTSDAIACQTPSAPAKNIIFENITSNSTEIDSIEKDGYGTVGYAIYINSENTWTAPVDGTPPTANTVWQNTGQQCIYLGTSTKPEAVVTGLSAETKYFIKAYAYNDCSGTEKYETTGKLDSISTKVNSSSVPSGDGSESNPYIISNLDELTWLMYNNTAWDKHYIQTANIDARTTKNWDNEAGFTPIGNKTTKFTGSYNGKGHIIDSLYINRPDSSYIGLFGDVSSSVIIDSLGLTNASVTGKIFTGILVGWNEGIINNSFTTGNVTANGNAEVYSGGFAGWSNNKINNCYSTASVNTPNGGSHIGGFIGRIYSNNAVLTNCYSTGLVTATGASTGGLIGSLSDGTATNCFWDTQTSGQATSAEGTGKTTAQMKDINTYLDAGWDVMDEIENGTNDIWGINNSDNNGYPFLSWQGYNNVTPCFKPESPVSNIVLRNVLAESINLRSFTGTADGYVIYINSTNSFTAPTNGTTPTANTAWKDAGKQCVYSGTSATPNVTVTGLSTACSVYYFKIYAYNVCSGSNLYETTGAGISAGGDTESPVFSSTHSNKVIDAAANCESALPDYTTNVTATDNCTQNANLSVTQLPTAGTILSGATNKVTLTVTDEGGNNVSTSFNVAVADNTAPVPNTSTLSDLNGNCSVTVTTTPTANDNCSGTINGTSTYGATPFTLTETSTIVWTYTDDAGNTATQNQQVTITDNTAPVPNTSTLSDLNGNCSVTVTTTPTANDNCSGTINGTSTYGTTPFTLTETSTIVWTYTDEAGNTVTQNQQVTIADNTAPVPNTSTLSDLNGNCSVTVTTTPRANDNCSGTINGTSTYGATPFTVTETSTIVWTYTDEAGNTATQNQQVTIADNTAPVPNTSTLSDLNGNCSVTVTTTPTANDNCSGTINGTSTYGTTPFTLTETSTIVWTYTDEAGNTVTQNQQVTIADTQNPVISCIDNQTKKITSNETVYTVSGTEFNPVSSNDNCTVTSIINDFNNTETLDAAEFPIGTTTVIWTVTDAAGNTANCSFDVAVSISDDIYELEEMGISIYPNPVNDMLNIVCNKKGIQSIIIIDVLGKTIFEKVNASQTESINMSGIPSGIYIIRIIINGKSITHRIIKK